MNEKKMNRYVVLLLTFLLSMIVGAVFMLLVGYDPIKAYSELIRGAFIGSGNIGTTLQKFVPILLTGLGFALAGSVGCFNCGIEGSLYLGAMTAAIVGHYAAALPMPIHFLACFAAAMTVGGLWAAIPGFLKVKWGVDEICVTLLATYVAKFFTSWLCNGPLSAGTGIPQTKPVAEDILLPQFLKPSQSNAGLFIALLVLVFVIWMMARSTMGMKLKMVGLNPMNAQYLGINSKKTVMAGMILSGVMGGIAGAIEVLGVYGCYLDNFSVNISNDGMLASLIVSNDIFLVPLMSFFISALKAGALSMERFAGVPRSVVDTLTAIFIIFATMETLFYFLVKNKKQKGGNKK